MQAVTLKPKKELDSGRGGAEVWSVVELDREERAEVVVEVMVGDVGGRVASYPVTVVVEDVNDNPMKAGAKVVRLWKVQGGGADVSLGRVYVEDPDDWDLEDKSFRWAGPPHPLFSLRQDTGEMFGSSLLRERRVWLASFLDSARSPRRNPPPRAPPHPPRGPLKRVVGGREVEVVIVSVYGSPPSSPPPPQATPTPIPQAWVWVCVKDLVTGALMDPVKLQGLLSLHQDELERVMNLRVMVGSAATPSPTFTPPLHTPSSATPPIHPPSLASMVLPLQVVDTNMTSLVTPRLSHAPSCPPRGPHHEGEACTPTSCLNGGRCAMGKRCLCPVGSSGPRCKILSRSFLGRGWVWVRPPTPCLPTTISLQLLPLHPDALLLYSGPLSPSPSPHWHPPTPLLVVQLVGGRPQVLVGGIGGEGGPGGLGGPVKVEVNVTLMLRTWHTLHLHVTTQGVVLAVEGCGGEGAAPPTNPCLARAGWGQEGEGRVGGWTSGGPLQLVDLGEPAHSSGSKGGCHPQETACGRENPCGRRGRCVGGLENPWCECEAGWAGKAEVLAGKAGVLAEKVCSSRTIPAFFPPSSFAQLSLPPPHSPPLYSVEVEVRVRARGRPEGLVLRLEDDSHTHAFRIKLRGGVACAGVDEAWQKAREVCLEGVQLGDGAWHSLRARRQGHNIEIVLIILWRAGVCIDDIRLGGKPLPLPPTLNHTPWAHVTALRGLQPGCPAPDPCPATTCLPPMTCRPVLDPRCCICGPGRKLLGRQCVDVDECLYQPCLHGGTCYNLKPRYRCACGPAHGGDNCEWVKMEAHSHHPLNAPLAVAALTLSILVVVLIGVLLTVRHHRARAARGEALGGLTKGAEVLGGRLSPQHTPTTTTTTCLAHTTAPAHACLTPLGWLHHDQAAPGHV
ncbi:putative neural-cadherin 2 [Chionoecetes opilio]|uniref:Putative neural-cadherin 2 n=1 Tax=Chionoecetes opilio TaxID=41210 RepID=A0A8J4Y821_CHIOP|nr:putative neural-cadherin 2 [Chionoecetes opilio]